MARWAGAWDVGRSFVQKRDDREKAVKELFKIIMTENFPKLMSDTKPQWLRQ